MYLTCKSYYSLHYGTQSIDQLIEAALQRRQTYLGLADVNTSAGVWEFIEKCQQNNLQAIVGVAFHRTDGQHLYTGIARNHHGLFQLNTFLSQHNLQAKPFPPKAPTLPDVYFLYPLGSPFTPPVLGPNHYISVSPKQLPVLKLRLSTTEKCIINQPIIMAQPEDYLFHAYLVAIDRNVLLSQLKPEWLGPKDAHWLPLIQELQSRNQAPTIFRQTDTFAESCFFQFDFKQRLNKKSFTGLPKQDQELLKTLAYNGLHSRYGTQNAKALERMERELEVIFALGFTTYYLITYDMVQYSMQKGYYHVGRGSGANSLVAYCLRITDVDPIELDLYFERFLNPKRSSPPDFDIDYSWTDREDVQQYLLNRHGSEHAALLGATITFQGRSILRELGKVRGLPKADIDRIIQEPEHPLVQGSSTLARIVTIGQRMLQFPSGHSIHAGGIVISEAPLAYYTALILPPKGLPTAELDMYEAERIGLDKFDVLSQRGIGHINQAVELVRRHQNITIDIHDIPAIKQDPQVAERLYNGDTMGCFYVESPAMRQLLQKLHCREYTTLVAASSIIRPGVASSGMMKEYVERYNNPNSFQYLHPVMEEHLGETFGVMVYQEDVLKVCHHYAGMDLGDADILRRAMSGKHRSSEAFAKIKDQFFNGAKALGRPEATTAEIWRQVSSFGGYSFCKAHSASFAVESFQSMYLKNYYPLEFYVAVINNFGGFYQTWVYVNEAVKAGGKLCGICVNNSHILTDLKTLPDAQERAIYIGFIHVQGLEKKWMEAIVTHRQLRGPFQSLEDFSYRLPVPFLQLRLLIKAGGFDFTGLSRKQLLMQARFLAHKEDAETDVGLAFLPPKPQIPYLPPATDTPLEKALDEYELLGFPVSLPWFELLQTPWRPRVIARNLGQYMGQQVKTIGKLVCTKPITTRLGQRMVFGTFIDHEGNFIDTVHFPLSLASFPLGGEGFYLLLGKVTQDFGVYSIEVEKCAPLPLKTVSPPQTALAQTAAA